jgi:hypothetical protein
MIGDLEYVQYAAAEYIRQLKEDREQAFVVTFDETVVLRHNVTDDKQALIGAIDDIYIGARTALLDAFYYTMRELDAHRERPVLVLLTDGADLASFYTPEDVVALAAIRPDLTVFTIGVGSRKGHTDTPPKELLQELAASTNGEFFDVAEGKSLAKVFATIRDILENEAVITVVDPKPAGKPGQVVVRSKNPNCRIKMLRKLKVREDHRNDPTREPIPKPYPDPPQAYSTQLTPGHRELFLRSSEKTVDRTCSAASYFHKVFDGANLEPMWFFHVGQRDISGCGLDCTMDHGQLYDPSSRDMRVHNEKVKLSARAFEYPIRPMERLPNEPEEAMDALAETALLLAGSDIAPDPSKIPAWQHARPFHDYPNLVHGMTFMEMRPVLARAAMLYPQYRSWAEGKLKAAAEVEITFLLDKYRRRFPDYPEEVLAQAARHSEDGQRILFRAENPSEVDLQQYLAAWLGDITAFDLFRRWEADRIDRILDGTDGAADAERFVKGWKELRKVFYVPSYARTLTLLQPVYDRECDCVGFWRVVLPRSSWMKPRVQEGEMYEMFSRRFLDLVPDLPFGYWLTDQVRQRNPEVIDYLRDGGFRAKEIVYNVVGEPARRTPMEAYDGTRMKVVFERPPSGPAARAKLELIADIGLQGVTWSVDAPPAGVPEPDLRALAFLVENDDQLDTMTESIGQAAAKVETSAVAEGEEPADDGTLSVDDAWKKLTGGGGGGG